MSQWKFELEVLDDGGLVVRFDPQLPPSTGTMITAPLSAQYPAASAMVIAKRILAASQKNSLPRALAKGLRDRAARDEELAKTKCDQTDSFMYVLGRAQTLKVIAEELDALEQGGTEPEKPAVQP